MDDRLTVIGLWLIAAITLVALLPLTGGISVGGAPGSADSAAGVVASTRLLTAALLLSLGPGIGGAEIAAAAAVFGLTGLASFVAFALAELFPEATAAMSPDALDLNARAVLPLGLALAVAFPWDRWPIRWGRARSFGFATAALAVAAAPLLAADLAGGQLVELGIDPDVAHVAAAALAIVIILAVRARTSALWRWALLAAAAGLAAAWTRITALPLSVGWYLSLGLSLTAGGVVLVGVSRDLGHGMRAAAIGQVRRRFEARIERMALHDDVTGLPNAHQVRLRIDEALAEGREVTLIFLALDGLDDILDAFGQQRLDDLLRAVAVRIGAEFGSLGALGRVGDADFALLRPGSSDDCLALAAQMVRVLDDPLDVSGVPLTVAAAAGCARVWGRNGWRACSPPRRACGPRRPTTWAPGPRVRRGPGDAPSGPDRAHR